MNNNYYIKKHDQSIWQGENKRWNTYVKGENGKRKLISKRERSELLEYIAEYYKRIEDNPKVKELFAEMLERKLKREQITLSTFSRYNQDFDRYYSKFGECRVRFIQDYELVEFLEDAVFDNHLKAKAFSNLKTITRAIFKYARKKRYTTINIEDVFLDLDVCSKDFSKEKKADNQECFTEEEYPVMMNYLCNNIDVHNLAILLMFVTGIRCGECCSLKREDFSEDKASFHIERTETRYWLDGKYNITVKDFPKTKAGVRTVVLPLDYVWIVEKAFELCPCGEFLFMKNDKRVNEHMVGARMYRICDKLGIQRKGPHKARKTYASILLDSGVDNNLIISQLGHTTIQTTEIHYHRNRKTIDTKKDIISRIPELKTI